MAVSDINLADRSGSLVESHKGYDPRIIFFYFVIAALLVTLVAGLAYQQLIKTDMHSERERQQNQRRVIVPGPRGNIYDRNGKLLVNNRPVFSVVLYVDELRAELRKEQIRIRRNYREMDDKNVPSRWQLEQIARVSLAQRYLDRVIKILGRDPAAPEAKIDAKKIQRHFSRSLVLPYTLLDDLTPQDYAKLLEKLEVNSPLQVYTSSARSYPYKALASHVLGYVRPNEETEAEDFPGDDLMTFKMKGAVGKSGLEKQFDDALQGTPGGLIFRVDPSGFRINPPLQQLKPKQGKSITTSLDVDLQQVAEEGIGDQKGVAIALDVKTGEVLVMADKPDYGDLNEISPRASAEAWAKISEFNQSVSGYYQPGSTFKTVITVAGLRTGRLNPQDTSVDCVGVIKIGNRLFKCDNGHGRHGRVDLEHAIATSCDSYFWRHGVDDIGIDAIAAEARRFGLQREADIELPESGRSVIPDPADPVYRRKYHPGPWTAGDTANTSIGQGDVLVSPLQMACLAASLARGEVVTKPTLLHDPNRPVQHTEKLGLTPEQRAILVNGLVGCTTYGTAKPLTEVSLYRIPGVKVAGKTGTATHEVTIKDEQGNAKKSFINYAWFICFAPASNPEIAMAVMLEGDTIGEEFAGGANAAPIAARVMQRYFEKKTAAASAPAAGQFMKSTTASIP